MNTLDNMITYQKDGEGDDNGDTGKIGEDIQNQEEKKDENNINLDKLYDINDILNNHDNNNYNLNDYNNINYNINTDKYINDLLNNNNNDEKQTDNNNNEYNFENNIDINYDENKDENNLENKDENNNENNIEKKDENNIENNYNYNDNNNIYGINTDNINDKKDNININKDINYNDNNLNDNNNINNNINDIHSNENQNLNDNIKNNYNLNSNENNQINIANENNIINSQLINSQDNENTKNIIINNNNSNINKDNKTQKIEEKDIIDELIERIRANKQLTEKQSYKETLNKLDEDLKLGLERLNQIHTNRKSFLDTQKELKNDKYSNYKQFNDVLSELNKTKNQIKNKIYYQDGNYIDYKNMKIIRPRIYFQSESKKQIKRYPNNRNNKFYLSSIDGKIIVNGERRNVPSSMNDDEFFRTSMNLCQNKSKNYETININRSFAKEPKMYSHDKNYRYKNDINMDFFRKYGITRNNKFNKDYFKEELEKINDLLFSKSRRGIYNNNKFY